MKKLKKSEFSFPLYDTAPPYKDGRFIRGKTRTTIIRTEVEYCYCPATRILSVFRDSMVLYRDMISSVEDYQDALRTAEKNSTDNSTGPGNAGNFFKNHPPEKMLSHHKTLSDYRAS